MSVTLISVLHATINQKCIGSILYIIIYICRCELGLLVRRQGIFLSVFLSVSWDALLIIKKNKKNKKARLKILGRKEIGCQNAGVGVMENLRSRSNQEHGEFEKVTDVY